MTSRERIVSGMRPTGPLHLGHYFGVLVNWIRLQEEYDCFFFVADWHALTSEYSGPRKVATFIPELVKDWLAAGLDPKKCVIFQQSKIQDHAELHLLFSMTTPLGLLERCPTYKDMKEQLAAKDLNTYGFLGYPVLMGSDILMYRPQHVPVGHDQLPHLELCREMASRFNFLYGDFFPLPQAQLTKESKLPGLDGRKMSKSYGNGIYLRDTMDDVRPKVMTMLTDKNRLRKNDPGDPDACNLFPYHALLTPKEKQDEICAGCRDASFGCVDCKKVLLENMARFLEPIQARRKALEDDPGALEAVLNAGNAKAAKAADETMTALRQRLMESPGRSPEMYVDMAVDVMRGLGAEVQDPAEGDMEFTVASASGKKFLACCRNSEKKINVKALEQALGAAKKAGLPCLLLTGTQLNSKARKLADEQDGLAVVQTKIPHELNQALAGIID